MQGQRGRKARVLAWEAERSAAAAERNVCSSRTRSCHNVGEASKEARRSAIPKVGGSNARPHPRPSGVSRTKGRMPDRRLAKAPCQGASGRRTKPARSIGSLARGYKKLDPSEKSGKERKEGQRAGGRSPKARRMAEGGACQREGHKDEGKGSPPRASLRSERRSWGWRRGQPRRWRKGRKDGSSAKVGCKKRRAEPQASWRRGEARAGIGVSGDRG